MTSSWTVLVVAISLPIEIQTCEQRNKGTCGQVVHVFLHRGIQSEIAFTIQRHSEQLRPLTISGLPVMCLMIYE